jgi:hypothetical protein
VIGGNGASAVHANPSQPVLLHSKPVCCNLQPDAVYVFNITTSALKCVTPALHACTALHAGVVCPCLLLMLECCC